MYQLTKKQAQQIVDKMMQDIPYNINIMDKEGIIIGSGNKERIGTLHQGALEAIKQRKIVEIQIDKKYEKKGINLPIEMNHEIIGVVGISGDVEETRPFGNLVKSTVILLIEQSAALQKENIERYRRQEFLHLIINPDTVYTRELINQAQTYHINLANPAQIIYIEFPYEINEELSVSAYYPSFKISNHSQCIVVQETTIIESITRQIQNQHAEAFIAVSKTNNRISEGYRQSISAMRVIKGLLPSEKTISYADCEFIADLSEWLINEKKTVHLPQLMENDELIKTLQTFIICNLNINEAANQLIIHRNTLNYRLERIHKITGKNPKNILELTELIFILINRIQ
ncbi:CdaR family transcriptional regulator [Bacillus benzoevorans]|uniref:Carbohydrate diacid regulator n=1 Tax=Bacillus benzoevorans TaxID=1456 RepID=A0A7X0HSY9_9BACI|nr:sugar diacid recognition domain-containing protein [Bacillus benzoevorans]MBB6446238.1 carbohydrate diacid regulator [Bacillus benzoevorans]